MFCIYFIGIRGGLVQAIMRYAKVYNEKVPDYDKEKPNSWLVYQDFKYKKIILLLLLILYIPRQ